MAGRNRKRVVDCSTRRSRYVFIGPTEAVAKWRRIHHEELMKKDSKPGITMDIEREAGDALLRRDYARFEELCAEEAENCLWAMSRGYNPSEPGPDFSDSRVHDLYFANYYTEAVRNHIRNQLEDPARAREEWRNAVERHRQEGKYVHRNHFGVSG